MRKYVADELRVVMDYPEPDTFRVQLCIVGVTSVTGKETLEPVATVYVSNDPTDCNFEASAVLDVLARKARLLEPPEP